MAYTPPLIDLNGPSADDTPEAWEKVNQFFEDVATALNTGGGGFNYIKTALTGGGSDSLNGIDGAGLADGERALVVIGNNPATIRIYVVDEDSGLAESLPDIVAPLDNPGTKRWILGGYAVRYGTEAGTACEGNDARLLTMDKKAAAAGTDGTPSDSNRFATDSDSRLSNTRDPNAHAASHQHGGADEIATATPAANVIPKADASGKIPVGFLPSGIDLDVLSHVLQLKRGTQAETLAASLAAGEPMLDTDNMLLFASDGSTTHLASPMLIGPEAGLPTPTIARLFYFCSDSKKLFLCDGSTWEHANPQPDFDVEAVASSLWGIYWDVHSVDPDYSEGLNDRFTDESGIDTGASTATYNADGDYYGPVVDAFELITNSWEETTDDPDDAYCVLEVEPIDSITLDTDLKAWISIDDGTNYEQITGLSILREVGDHQFIKGVITGITAQTDKTCRLKITGHNSKHFNVHAIAAGVKYS